MGITFLAKIFLGKNRIAVTLSKVQFCTHTSTLISAHLFTLSSQNMGISAKVSRASCIMAHLSFRAINFVSLVKVVVSAKCARAWLSCQAFSLTVLHIKMHKMQIILRYISSRSTIGYTGNWLYANKRTNLLLKWSQI